MSLRLWEVPAPSVYAFKLWTREQCARWLKRIERLPPEVPNSMNKYGRYVNSLHVTKLVEEISALAGQLYDTKKLKRRAYAFAVEYTPKTQASLAKHFDTSDVTLNVCLGRRFTGGDLVFYKGRERYTVKQRVGWALLHLGSQEHCATPLLSGSRTNLILWCAERAA